MGRCLAGLGQDRPYDLAVDIGEPVVAALVAIGQLLVIDAQLVQDGSLQVVDMDGILGDIDAVIVGLAVAHTATDSSASHPVAEAVGMMVAAVDF